MSKRGQVGLDTAKAVIISLMILGILAFAFLIILGTTGTNDAITSTTSGSYANTTFTFSASYNTSYDDQEGIALTNVIITNASDGTIVTSDNYTIAGGRIEEADGTSLYLAQSVNLTADYSFTDRGDYGAVSNNLSSGISTFFSNATTWFILLGVVVIILIIVIVVVVVQRFGKPL